MSFLSSKTTLRGEPLEIFFSVMKTDERSSQGEGTVSEIHIFTSDSELIYSFLSGINHCLVIKF